MSSTTSNAVATTVASGPSESTPRKAGGSSNTTPLAPLKMPPPSDDEKDMPYGSFLRRNLFPVDPSSSALGEEDFTQTNSLPAMVRSHSAYASSVPDDLPLGEQPVLKRGVTSPF